MGDTQNEIRFFGPTGKRKRFSNYHMHYVPYECLGMSVYSVEHGYQANKYIYESGNAATDEANRKYARVIAMCETPYRAKFLAQRRQPTRYRHKWELANAAIVNQHPDARPDPNWHARSIDVMRQCLLAKFRSCVDCRRDLLDTGDAILIEESPYDSFWGCGKDGKGQNHLGKLLMEVRAAL